MNLQTTLTIGGAVWLFLQSGLMYLKITREFDISWWLVPAPTYAVALLVAFIAYQLWQNMPGPQ